MNESLRRFIITYAGVLLVLCIMLVVISVWPFPKHEPPKNQPEKAIQPEKQPVAPDAAQPGDGLGGQPIDSDKNNQQRISTLEKREARDRFVGAEVLAEKTTPLENGMESRVRLLQIDDFAFPILVEEKIRTDADGRKWLSSQKAMVANRLLIVPANEEAAGELKAFAEKEGYILEANGPHSSVLKMTSPEVSLDAISAMMKKLAPLEERGLLVAEPDYLYFPDKVPTDPFFARQSALQRMEAAGAWNITTGSENVVVAVIDTGMDLDHPDLADNLWVNPREIASNGQDDDDNGKIDDINGWDFYGISGDNEDNRPEDQEDHGSHVSGILGASGNNGRGIAGINWKVKIIPLRVGNGLFPTSSLEPALNYVQFLKQNRGVNIVATNNSYGSESFSRIMQSAIARHRQTGILFVAAAGNDGFSNDILPQYPASYELDNIIAVAATTGGENLASLSNFGHESVDLGAPGSQIYSTVRRGGYDYASGTSMSAPQVTGAAALLSASNPELDYLEIKQLILGTTDPFPTLQGKTVTGGRLNLRRALEASRNLTPVRLVSLNSPVVHLENANSGLFLEARLEISGQPVEQAGGTLSWVPIPENSGVFLQPSGFRGVVAYFPGDGDYRLRATYTEDLRLESREAFVRVGDAELLADGLTGYWKFDEGSGNTATDSSGANRHGSLAGPTWSTGFIGGALRFDGVNDGLSFPYNSLASFTVVAWVRADTRGNSVFPRIMNTPEFILYWGRRDNGFEPDQKTVKFVAERTAGIGVWNTLDDVIEDGQWFHVAVTYNASADFAEPKIYVDGASVPVATQEPPPGSRVTASGLGYIGDNGDPGLTRNWDGLIDEVRLYNRILAPSEVAALASGNSFASAPVVNAGGDISVNAASIVTLQGKADSGATLQWEWVSGPASPQISNPFSLQTEVVFPAPGEYRLRLLADNGEAISVDEVHITVLPEVTEPANDVFGGVAIDGFPGWHASEWYLNYNIDFWPWIFHEEHGWQFILEESAAETIFVWDAGLEDWIFFNQNTYRWMFLFVENSGWIWTFPSNTPEQRFFQNSQSGALFSIPAGI